mmetsp:Transcript_37725/g.118287  ORF Transcript_37725/g.118287 Transcript_37725/m.118287 type:complete len:222 (+) Transcript_37725:377-1042(+)
MHGLRPAHRHRPPPFRPTRRMDRRSGSAPCAGCSSRRPTSPRRPPSPCCGRAFKMRAASARGSLRRQSIARSVCASSSGTTSAGQRRRSRTASSSAASPAGLPAAGRTSVRASKTTRESRQRRGATTRPVWSRSEWQPSPLLGQLWSAGFSMQRQLHIPYQSRECTVVAFVCTCAYTGRRAGETNRHRRTTERVYVHASLVSGVWRGALCCAALRNRRNRM